MIYLFGSNGMLGNYIKKYFKKYNIVSYTRNDYDINMLTYNNLNLFFENNNIKKDDIIINCAGVIPQRNKNNIDYYNA
jgi:dTDP-4-dehydrorhamnose reductase